MLAILRKARIPSATTELGRGAYLRMARCGIFAPDFTVGSLVHGSEDNLREKDIFRAPANSVRVVPWEQVYRAPN